MKENNVVASIKFVALAMFVLGIVGLAIFKFDLITCLTSIFSSFFAYGFAYIVDAACKYIEKCEKEYYSELNKPEE